MMTAWLHIVGIGEDGLAGLAPATRAVVESAEVIIGGDRHHRLSETVQALRVAWPSPFDALIEVLKSYRGRRVVVLATGDPLWYSVGARIGRAIPAAQITYHPQLSAFQLAAARMGWSLPDVDTLTVHGRPAEQIVPFIAPDARLLILTTGADTPAQIAAMLTDRGYGDSRISVLAAMGGPREQRFDGVARAWRADVPAFNTLAVDCVAGADSVVLARTPGLPDHVFAHDGTMTKQEIRAVTLARLMPMRGGVLWDIGCGCGSVAVEWMRAAPEALAIGLEPRADRRALAAQNALSLGAPKLRLIEGAAPEVLQDLPAPDAIFFGGGISAEAIDHAVHSLRPFGRLVANAVTLESEAILLDQQARRGGDLTRLSVQRAEPVGSRHGWRPAMPVTQWSMTKA